MKDLHNWMSTTHRYVPLQSRGKSLFSLLCCFFVWSSVASAENTIAAADGFLKQLLGAEYHGMGGSFVGATRGANALGSNPAGISVATGNRFVIHATRFPRTIALLSKPDFDENYQDYSQYEQRATGIETLNWAFPMGKFGSFGLALAFEQEGAFRRVNHEGKALNSFPENNLAIGLGYGLNLFGAGGIFPAKRGKYLCVVGFDAKWLRSKVADAAGSEHLGHGYAYNIGIIQQLGDAIQVGVVMRNLSNGLSFSDAAIPDAIHRDLIAGIAYHRQVSDVALRFGLDIHPPFSLQDKTPAKQGLIPSGIRANLGAEAWYRQRIGGRIGYLRDTEKRYASVLLLEDATFEIEERLWKAEGLCFGLGVRLGSFTLNAAYIPQFKPTVLEGERIYIVQGEAVYTFSIGQTF